MANEKTIQIKGDQVIETYSVSTTFDKSEYLATKEAELIAHDLKLQEHIATQTQIRKELVALIDSIK